jgi:hypothetical protein
LRKRDTRGLDLIHMNLRLFQVGFVEKKRGSGAGFPRTIFSPVLITLLFLDTHLLADICTTGPYEAEIQWELTFTRHLQVKKKKNCL